MECTILTIRSLAAVRSVQGVLEGLDAIGDGRVEIEDADGVRHPLARGILETAELVATDGGWLWIPQAAEPCGLFHEGADGLRRIGSCSLVTYPSGGGSLGLELDSFLDSEALRTLAARLEDGAWKHVGVLRVKGGGAEDLLEAFRGRAGFWCLEVEAPGRPLDLGRLGAFRRHLKWLELRDCAIEPGRFAMIRNLSWLESLELVRVDLAENELACLPALAKLGVLHLEGDWVGDAGAAHAGRCAGLVELRIASERLGGQGVRALGGLSILRELDLESDRIGDDAVPFLLQLGELETLDLRFTGVTSVGEECLRSHLPGLETLHVPASGVLRPVHADQECVEILIGSRKGA